MDSEQVWRVTAGAASVQLGGGEDEGEAHDVGEGDTLVLPAEILRRVVADPVTGLTAMVTGLGAARARVPDADPVVPPWIA